MTNFNLNMFISKNKKKKTAKRLAVLSSEVILKKINHCNRLFYKNFILYFLPNNSPFLNTVFSKEEVENTVELAKNFYESKNIDDETRLMNYVHNGVKKLPNLELINFLLDYITFLDLMPLFSLEETENKKITQSALNEISSIIDNNLYEFVNGNLKSIMDVLIKNIGNVTMNNKIEKARLFDGEQVSAFYIKDLPF
jgi:hypothetical protein